MENIRYVAPSIVIFFEKSTVESLMNEHINYNIIYYTAKNQYTDLIEMIRQKVITEGD